MKTPQIILITIAILGSLFMLASHLLTGDYAYVVKDSTVFYHKLNDGQSKLEAREMLEADPKSFKRLGHGYGKDKNHVYREGRILRSAKPATFRIIDGTYQLARDAEAVFYHSQRISEDPDHFTILKKGIYKDSDYVYYGNKPIRGVDAASFEFLHDEGYYAKDEQQVYYATEPIENVVYDSFEYLGQAYAKDENQVYYCGYAILHADPATFQFLNDQYGKDAKHVYYQKKLVEGADAESFIIEEDKDGVTIGYDRQQRFEYGKAIPPVERP